MFKETIAFQIVKIAYYNQDKNFQVLYGRLGNNAEAKIVIKSNREIPVDTQIVVVGIWVNKEIYGPQFEVDEILEMNN
jgi:hypothetical protein